MAEEPEVQTGENGTCYHCGGEPAAEPHECPYASEINGNDRKCNCREGCQQECAWDI